MKTSKIELHNRLMHIIARDIRRELRDNPTEAELVFEKEAKSIGIKLKSQYRIDVPSKDSSYIKCFYFADFCDVDNMIIFEVDGGYHNEKAQIRKDERRTRDLRRLGYSVFRITNKEVFLGKTREFIYKAYLDRGIKL